MTMTQRANLGERVNAVARSILDRFEVDYEPATPRVDMHDPQDPDDPTAERIGLLTGFVCRDWIDGEPWRMVLMVTAVEDIALLVGTSPKTPPDIRARLMSPVFRMSLDALYATRVDHLMAWLGSDTRRLAYVDKWRHRTKYRQDTLIGDIAGGLWTEYWEVMCIVADRLVVWAGEPDGLALSPNTLP